METKQAWNKCYTEMASHRSEEALVYVGARLVHVATMWRWKLGSKCYTGMALPALIKLPWERE